MRIYTKAGDLAFKVFDFPDGQPHFKLETYERDFSTVTVETCISSPRDLFLVMVVSSVLRHHGYAEIQLDIRYLMAARMDRAISWAEPFTLELVARVINSCGFSRVRILDVHSEIALKQIRNSSNVLPMTIVEQVVNATCGTPVVPDKGAVPRVNALLPGSDKIYCQKTREMSTGNLTKFAITDDFYLKANLQYPVLIIDDICDGGATFIGLAKVLREAGAKKVYLYVTHGIFSKGLPLEGIDGIYTTDSYWEYPKVSNNFPLTVIPVSMEKL